MNTGGNEAFWRGPIKSSVLARQVQIVTAWIFIVTCLMYSCAIFAHLYQHNFRGSVSHEILVLAIFVAVEVSSILMLLNKGRNSSNILMTGSIIWILEWWFFDIGIYDTVLMSHVFTLQKPASSALFMSFIVVPILLPYLSWRAVIASRAVWASRRSGMGEDAGNLDALIAKTSGRRAAVVLLAGAVGIIGLVHYFALSSRFQRALSPEEVRRKIGAACKKEYLLEIAVTLYYFRTMALGEKRPPIDAIIAQAADGIDTAFNFWNLSSQDEEKMNSWAVGVVNRFDFPYTGHSSRALKTATCFLLKDGAYSFTIFSSELIRMRSQYPAAYEEIFDHVEDMNIR